MINLETEVLSKIRNIGFAAHIDAGKTTTTERVLFYSGKLHRMGEVDDGTATTDFLQQERERGITINSAVISCEWKGHLINIIDTPGHVDFTIEVERSLRVLDGLVLIFCAVGGVQPQSETVWRQAERYGIPIIAYVNKMDRVGASYFKVVKKIREKFGVQSIVLQIPIGEESNFQGIVDLITEKAFVYVDELGMEYKEIPVPEELKSIVRDYREFLIEKVVENDDRLLARFLEDKPITPEDLRLAIRRTVLSRKLIPVLCGSSLHNKGVQFLLDAIVEYLPSPLDRGGVEGVDAEKVLQKRNPSPIEPFCGVAFKIKIDSFLGKLVFVRIYSGTIKSGKRIYNSVADKKEKINKILQVFADRHIEIPQLKAGELGALVGLKFTKTGDTLCSEENPIVLKGMEIPQPVISASVEPKSIKELDKLLDALKNIAEEDPTFKFKIDEDTGEIVIFGMGELHLEIIVDRLIREFKVEPRVGKPQVSFKETIIEKVEAEAEFLRQIGGRPHYAKAKLILNPLPPVGRVEFKSALPGSLKFPQQLLEAVREGFMSSLEVGPLAGYPVIDVEGVLIDVVYNPLEASSVAFKAATSLAVMDALSKSKVLLKEPVMKVEVIVGEEYVGEVMGDLNIRRAHIESIEVLSGQAKAITALVPLSEMFGYATDLRSCTQGRGIYTMEFHHYELVPQGVADKILGRI